MERAARELRSPALVAAAEVEGDGFEAGCLAVVMKSIQVQDGCGETERCCAGGCRCCARLDEVGVIGKRR